MHGRALALLVLALAGGALAGQALKDQFDRELDLGAAAAAGDLVIMWSDQRDAAEALEAWGAAIASAGVPPAGARVVAVSDLRALPFFVPRAAVTGSLRKDHPDRPIYLDWKGAVAARWSLPPGGVAVLVVGRGGQLKARETGPVTPAAAARVRQALGLPR